MLKLLKFLLIFADKIFLFEIVFFNKISKNLNESSIIKFWYEIISFWNELSFFLLKEKFYQFQIENY